MPLGLPSMSALGAYIKANTSFAEPEDQTQFEQFKQRFDTTGDLETTLLEVQLRPAVLKQIIFKTWELVNKADHDAYQVLLDNPDSCPLVKLIEYLLGTASKKLSLITTNYDRIAEYAASFARAIICTGYAPNYIGHFSSVIHTNNLATIKGYKGQVNIWKVHGSLDWFKTPMEEDIQLPLRQTIPDNYMPLIVTPGLSKYYETHNEPYRTIFAQADSEIENANGFLCIGYGFNDIHVQPKLITKIKQNKPIIVITKQLTSRTKDTIIGKSNHYVLMEEELSSNGTRIYSSDHPEYTIPDVSYWKLDEYIKLVTT